MDHRGGQPDDPVDVRQLVERFQRVSASQRATPRDLARRLLLTADQDAYAEWLCGRHRAHSDTGPGDRSGPFDGRLRGLLLHDGRGSGMPPDNAWGIPPGAGLAEALRHVWHPLADLAPKAVECLIRHVFAVALVAHPDGESLAYLYTTERANDADGKPVRNLRELIGSGGYPAEICWGDAPRPLPAATVDLFAGQPPPALGLVSGVHSGFCFTGLEGRIFPTRVLRYDEWLEADDEDDDLSDEEVDETRPPGDRVVVFADFVDGGAGFDRDTADSDGNPLVVMHDPNDGLDDTGQPFWAWFEFDIQFQITEGEVESPDSD